MSAARTARDGRHRAREAALQLLYQREVGSVEGADLQAAVTRYWEEHPAPEARQAFTARLLQGTVQALDEIDRLLEAAADNWRLSRMSVVDRTVLRLGTYELLEGAAPAAVVIDEAIELARTFSGEEAARFVNGVLDGVKRALDRRAASAGPSDDLEPAQ
ncbi:MAG: transcription antitermination factor NusB [Acidobacteria bacterium]|nr:transcription antitermination factor NusB [Acidobacteriota bacterium]